MIHMSADDAVSWSPDGPKHTSSWQIPNAFQNTNKTTTTTKTDEEQAFFKIFTYPPIQMVGQCVKNIKSVVAFFIPPCGTQLLHNP